MREIELASLNSEIERVTGGVLSWNQQPYPGNVRSAISFSVSIEIVRMNENNRYDMGEVIR